MSNVTLQIAGRTYQVASGEGEEDHLTRLGRMIDERLAGQDGMAGQSEVRRLLYAALILADELHEAQTGSAPVSLPEGEAGPLEDMAERLEALADKLENIRA